MESVMAYSLTAIACAVILFAIAGVLKFVLRFVFRKIKFIACLVIALIALSTFGLGFAKNPNTTTGEGTSDTIKKAIDEFKGIYSAKIPFLAYKFEQSEEEAFAEDGTETVRIDISYLPLGNAQIEYDPEHGRFRLVKPLEITFLNSLMNGDGEENQFKLPSFSMDKLKENAANTMENLAEIIGK